jgi:hypothetical protein
MRGFLSFFLILVLSESAVANEVYDSIAIFQQEHRSTIVINETGGSKLDQIMSALAPGRNAAEWRSPNADIILNCQRSFTPYPENDVFSCTFQFIETEKVHFTAQTMRAQDGAVDDNSSDLFNLSFTNKTGDSFSLTMKESSFRAESRKSYRVE